MDYEGVISSYLFWTFPVLGFILQQNQSAEVLHTLSLVHNLKRAWKKINSA